MFSLATKFAFLVLSIACSLQQPNPYHMGGSRNIFNVSLRTSNWARLHLSNPCRSAAPFRTDREPMMSELDLRGRELTLLAMARMGREMVQNILNKLVST